MHQFEHELLKAIGGEYEFTSGGVSLAADLNFTWADWRATEKHELIHSELVDMSVYGCFQRLMLDLKRSALVPVEHRDVYERVWKQMYQHCFSVHEGIASYRTVLWYTAYANTAEVAIAHLPDDYRKAFDLISTFMPGDLAQDQSLQSAYHAICDIAGVFLLDPPLTDYYADWQLLGKEELKYVNLEGPDYRLMQLVSHRDVACSILREALLRLAKIISQDLKKPGDALSSSYWLAFNETITALAQAVPNMPTCSPSEKSGSVRRLLMRWEKQQIPHPYGSELRSGKNDTSLWSAVDVGAFKLIHNVRFKSMNVDTALRRYEEHPLDTPLQYIETLDNISNRGNLAFMICVCNASSQEIPLVRGNTLPQDTVAGTFFEVRGDSLASGIVQVQDSILWNFTFRFSVLQSVEGAHVQKLNVVRFVNVAHYSTIKNEKFSQVCPCIVRVIDFEDFSGVIHSETCDYCGCWGMKTTGISALGYVASKRVYFYPVTLFQKLECEKELLSLGGDNRNVPSFALGGGMHLSVAQIAALAFFGMDTTAQTEPVKEIARYTQNLQRGGGESMKWLDELFERSRRKSQYEEKMPSLSSDGSGSDLDKYFKDSGYTGAGWKCGRCGALYSLPEKIGAKTVMCTSCGFLIPNKRL